MGFVKMSFGRALLGAATLSASIYFVLSFMTPKPNEDDDSEDEEKKTIQAKACDNKLSISLAVGAIVLLLNYSACSPARPTSPHSVSI